MPPRRLALLIVLGIMAGAATYPTDRLSFPTDRIGFRTDTLSFGTDTIGFRTDAIVFRSTPMTVETPATIEVTLSADVLFDFDKADIRAAAQPALREVADLIRDKARGPVTIRGFTDALGNDAYNQKLSDRRALAVKTWLATKENLGKTPFTTTGLGARNPVAPNTRPDGSDNPEGRQLNRRVTLIIRK